MSERQGVEIDYCPQCRGIWLGRGELDKILDRALPAPSAAVPVAPVPASAAPIRRDDPRYDPRYRDERDRDSHAHGDKKKRKGSWLGDILDF